MFNPFNNPQNLNALPRMYFARQRVRVRNTEERVLKAPSSSRAGRVFPTSGDLPIGRGRHLQAAVMFLDICKFSGRNMDTQFDQTLLMNSITVFFSEIIRIIEDYGGNVEKNTGDGLMAYFPHSQAVADAHRASSCAMTIMLAADRLLNPLLEQYLYAPFQFRICLNAGPITVAEVGKHRGFRSSVAIGTAANIASKMLSCCAAGQILIGERAVRRLPADWQAECTQFHSADERWTYLNGLAYAFYELTCRWPPQNYPERLS